MTRIVAGAARGRRLTVPPAGTRPTADRAREALFSSLESQLGGLEGLSVIDLYAGSGAVGLEALSRGAVRVLLVESDRRAADVAKSNVRAVGLPGATVLVRPAERLGPNPDPAYDVLFADPPYDVPTKQLGAVLTGLADGGWLTQEALVVVERSKRDDWEWPEGYAASHDRKYGEARLWYGHRE